MYNIKHKKHTKENLLVISRRDRASTYSKCLKLISRTESRIEGALMHSPCTLDTAVKA